MHKIKFLFTFIALFNFQFNYSEVNTNKNERVVSKSNYTHKEKKLINFEPSVNDETKLEGFSLHVKYYMINSPIELVWDAYENTKPNECWSGPLTKYKNSYTNSLFHDFREENHPSFVEGSVYLIRLKVIPFIKIGVLFQLTKLDHSEKLIELTYGMDNTSHGKQTIQFITDGDKTLIKHTSYFKSKSAFRDKHLYSKFHVKYIDEFHANIQKQLIENQIIDIVIQPQEPNKLLSR